MGKYPLNLILGAMGLLSTVNLAAQPQYDYSNMQREKLDRGVVAVKSGNSVFVSWRFFDTDPEDTQFEVWRNGIKKASSVRTSSNYRDSSGSAGDEYFVVAKRGNGEGMDTSKVVKAWSDVYMTVDIDRPASVKMNGSEVTYSPNDCSVGDVDADGEYEIILKWEPSNSQDNSKGGKTANVYFDCYKLDGTKLWRIDMGQNIRAGAHYTQFMVYDLDGDGMAEMACKTAPGTIDGKGHYVSEAGVTEDIRTVDNSRAYANSGGWILNGPEFLTVFSGKTGEALTTIDYYPSRGITTNDPSSSALDQIWGDNYGNRCDRYLACVAYLDGKKPSLVMCRGYYTRAYLVAYDFDGKQLVERWKYNSIKSGSNELYGQGNHNLSVADVDGDGCDEIIYGSAALDHDGTFLHSTRRGHGDAIHVGDLDPDRPGLEIFQVHESSPYGFTLRDARTGEILVEKSASGDTGRGVAADVSAATRGAEMWSSANGDVYSVNGDVAGQGKPSCNFRIFWDGDVLEEVLDGTKLDKYGSGRLMTFYNYGASTACNGTKNTPCLQADILGDWREEVILYNSDCTKLNIFTTTTPTEYRVPTLMQDHIYRMGVVWQNVAYNQPPHLGYYLPDSVKAAIYHVGGPLEQQAVVGDSIEEIRFKMKGGTAVALYSRGLPTGVTIKKDTKDELGLTYVVSGVPKVAKSCDFEVYSSGGAESASVFGRIDVSVSDGIGAVESSDDEWISLSSTYFDNSISMELNMSKSDKITVSLFASSGSKVAEKSFGASCGEGCVMNGLEGLSSGMYILRADNGSEVRTFKVVKK